MSQTKRKFFYDKGNYLCALKPEFEANYFTPKIIIQFGVVLPFFIPFPERVRYFHIITSDEVCCIMFSSITEKQKVYMGTYQNDETEVDIKKTRVEITYAFRRNIDISENTEEELLNNIFDESLSRLNNIIQAYIVKTGDNMVYRLTKENLDLMLFFQISNGQNYKALNQLLFLLHPNAPEAECNYLSDEETDEIMKYVVVVGRKINPFLSVNEMMISSRRIFNSGDYRQAVINVQTSVEIFMYLIYREFLKQEGFTIDEINSKSERMRFKSLVENQFVKRIGGNFDIDDPSAKIGKWWLHTYSLRNKVVHEGYYPSFDECDDAIYCANNAIEYVLELINNDLNKSKYSAIQKYIITQKQPSPLGQ